MTILAMDLGGSRIKLGIVNGGRVVDSVRVKSQSEGRLQDQLPQIKRELLALCEKHSIQSEQCLGVGCLSTGLVDTRENKILSANKKFEDGPELDLQGWAKEEFSLPLRLENDAHAAMLGEWKHGAGRGRENIVMLTLGTGIGSSVIIQGKPYRGKDGQGGLLGGHIMMDPYGDPCTCSSRGCAESLASGWSLAKLVASRTSSIDHPLASLNTVDFQTLYAYADRQDALAQEILDHCYRVWSAVVITMIHLFSPERVIVGGGVMHRADEILSYIRTWVDTYAWTGRNTIEITCAEHIEHAGLLGAEVLFDEGIEYL